MKRGRNIYHGLSTLLDRTAPRHGKEVATAVCVVSCATRDGAKAMAIVLVPYQLRGARAVKISIREGRPGPWETGEPGTHIDRTSAPSSHTWWPRDIVAHVGACGGCAEATRGALSAIDADDISQRRESARRVSDAIHDQARWSLYNWGAVPLTVYSAVWLADGEENWPRDRPRVPVSASVRAPCDITGLPDSDDPTALTRFERLAEARHHAFKVVFRAGVEPYGPNGLTLLSRAVRRNEERHKECADTLQALRDMRRRLFADRS